MTSLIEPQTFVVGVGERTWRVFGLRYPALSFSTLVYQRVMRANEERGGPGDLTALNTKLLLGSEEEYWLLVIDASDDGWYIENVDWWPGEPTPLHPDTLVQIVERRLALALAGENDHKVHYGLGAILSRGGVIIPLAGLDQ